eukprot:sb/3476476/
MSLIELELESLKLSVSLSLTCSTSVSSRTGPKARCELTRRMDRLRSKATLSLTIVSKVRFKRLDLRFLEIEAEWPRITNNNNNIPRLYTAHTQRKHVKILAMLRQVIRAVYPQANI